MKVEDALDDKQEKTSGNECPLKHTVLKSPFNLCGVLAMRLNPPVVLSSSLAVASMG
ncbi:MAG: hypothetical protein IPP36_11840 [Nitrosomonadales bacterium]|nr:hypothetical protein [Nitrosomonadales bacterium]